MKNYKFLFAIAFSLCNCISLVAQTNETLIAARNGDTEAMMTVSEWFRFGLKKLPASSDSADFYLNLAAKRGHKDAMYLVAVEKLKKIYDSKTYTKGMKLMEAAADSGSGDAMVKLFRVYSERKTGGQSDQYYSLPKAYKYASMAAKLEEFKGAMYQANALLTGKGVSRNDSLAYSIYDFWANRKKKATAQLILGKAHFEGKVTGKQDLEQAFNYLKACNDNPLASLDQRTEADIMIHKVDQTYRAAHNQVISANPFLPPGGFIYQLRK